MRNHDQVIADQFGSTAAAYLTSAVHAQGADLQDIAACARQYAQALILDMGCGGGHASFAVAPHARQVIAYDLSAGMLDACVRPLSALSKDRESVATCRTRARLIRTGPARRLH